MVIAFDIPLFSLDFVFKGAENRYTIVRPDWINADVMVNVITGGLPFPECAGAARPLSLSVYESGLIGDIVDGGLRDAVE